jgi:hypothetical protein
MTELAGHHREDRSIDQQLDELSVPTAHLGRQ